MKCLKPAFAVLLCLSATALYAEEKPALYSAIPDRIIISERSDFSKYEGGRYIGHVYREARVDIRTVSVLENSIAYEGDAIVYEETLRDQRSAAKLVDDVLPIAFTIDSIGSMDFSIDKAYPILRSMPKPVPKDAVPGDRWTGDGIVVVRPRPGFPATRIAVLAEYQYLGPSSYAGKAAQAIKARYAIRYKGNDRLGDLDMKSASGGRTADFLLDAENGSALFVRESIDESYSYTDVPDIRLKGFILHFYSNSLPQDQLRIARLIDPLTQKDMLGLEGSLPGQTDLPNSITVPEPPTGKDHFVPEPSEALPFELARGNKGLVLLLFDLRFIADSEQLLSSEKGRLDSIADALKKLPDKNFLVEGHTAELGRAAGQLELSRQRAKKIVDELIARGIDPGRLVYRGLGADKPIASNESEEGKARNRRVEITILD